MLRDIEGKQWSNSDRREKQSKKKERLSLPCDFSALRLNTHRGSISIVGPNETCQDHYQAKDMIRATSCRAPHSSLMRNILFSAHLVFAFF